MDVGGGGGGGGGIIVSADPEGCSSSSRLGSNAPWLVGTRRQSTQLLERFLNLFAVGPLQAPPLRPPLRPPDITHVMNRTRPSAFFAALPHPCIIVNGNEERGRPGNEATSVHHTVRFEGRGYAHNLATRCLVTKPLPHNNNNNYVIHSSLVPRLVHLAPVDYSTFLHTASD